MQIIRSWIKQQKKTTGKNQSKPKNQTQHLVTLALPKRKKLFASAEFNIAVLGPNNSAIRVLQYSISS